MSTDPPHHRDETLPCYGCGAVWTRDEGRTSMTMHHDPDCSWYRSAYSTATDRVHDKEIEDEN